MRMMIRRVFLMRACVLLESRPTRQRPALYSDGIGWVESILVVHAWVCVLALTWCVCVQRAHQSDGDVFQIYSFVKHILVWKMKRLSRWRHRHIHHESHNPSSPESRHQTTTHRIARTPPVPTMSRYVSGRMRYFRLWGNEYISCTRSACLYNIVCSAFQN